MDRIGLSMALVMAVPKVIEVDLISPKHARHDSRIFAHNIINQQFSWPHFCDPELPVQCANYIKVQFV